MLRPLATFVLIFAAGSTLLGEEKQEIVVLLDPSMKAIGPVLQKSFADFNFHGIEGMVADEPPPPARPRDDAFPVRRRSRGPLPASGKVRVEVGTRKTVKEWRYLIEIGKPGPVPGALSGVMIRVPYVVSFRESAADKPVKLVEGSIVSSGRDVNTALFSFAERGCVGTLGGDMRVRLGATLLSGKPSVFGSPIEPPQIYYPVAFEDGGATVRVDLKNKTPVRLRVSFTVANSFRSELSASWPSEGLQYLEPGEEKTVRINVADIPDVHPRFVSAGATPCDDLVATEDFKPPPVR